MEDNNNKKDYNSNFNNSTYDPRLILPPPPPPILNYYTPYIPNDQTSTIKAGYPYEPSNDELFKDQPYILLNDQYQIQPSLNYSSQEQKQQLIDYSPIKYVELDKNENDNKNWLKDINQQQKQEYYPIIPPYQPYNEIAPTQEFVNRVANRIREMEVEENMETSYNNNSGHEENVMDASMSMLILLLGIFFFIPFIFSVLYLKSRDKYARRFAIVSICIGLLYLLALVIMPFVKDYDDTTTTTTTIIMS